LAYLLENYKTDIINDEDEITQSAQEGLETSEIIVSDLQLDALKKRVDAESYNLIYSGKRDGWMFTDFHRCCDSQAPTVILFKSATGACFGGYIEIPWRGP